MSYSPPSSAKPFTLNISDNDLSEFKQLLKLSRIGPQTYEASQEDRRYGMTQKWITEAKDYWLNKYDWRAQEKNINSFPNYTTEIEGLEVHFVALFSEKKDATPILFMHGWPGSFIEFLPMADLIRNKYSAKDLPYHIIIPSLPGYTLSSGGPVDKDWSLVDTARVMNTLMNNLGFDKYIAQGGDIGSATSVLLSLTYDSCVALHLNMFSRPSHQPDEATLTDYEKEALARYKQWTTSGMAYGQEHGSRPSTIGFALNSNPLSLLSWIGEKFLEWSDDDPSLDDILTNVSLYWFTNGFPRSIYPYRAIFSADRKPTPELTKPFGFSWFPREIMPGIKSTMEKQGDLVFYKQHEKGGHFAALERPKELLEDVEEFAKVAWKV